METKRLFIALPVDPIISRDIVKKFSSLDLPWEKIKPVRSEQIHLTLKFLGEFKMENIPDLIDSLNKVKLGLKDLELSIDQTQIFSPDRPKILNLGIKNNQNLQKLYDQIEDALFDDGLAHKEGRRFSAHLTLARIKKSLQLDELTPFNTWTINKSFYTSYFELQESNLTKNGPEYTSLQTFDL